MSNRSGERTYLCLVPILRRKTLSLSPLSTMLVAVSFVEALIMLRSFFDSYLPGIEC